MRATARRRRRDVLLEDILRDRAEDGLTALRERLQLAFTQQLVEDALGHLHIVAAGGEVVQLLHGEEVAGGRLETSFIDGVGELLNGGLGDFIGHGGQVCGTVAGAEG